MGGGCLQQPRPYSVKILPHYHMVTEETYPCFKCFISVKVLYLEEALHISWEQPSLNKQLYHLSLILSF